MHRFPSGTFLSISMAFLAVAVGVLVAFNPLLGMCVALLGPIIWLIFLRPGFRLMVILVGALLVFQSTSEASGGKFLYLALAILCCAASAVGLGREGGRIPWVFRPMLLGAILLVFLLLLSAAVSLLQGVPVGSWASDISPYFLLVALPIVGLDAARSLSTAWVDRLIAVAGLLAAIGFAFDWLDKRGVSSLPVGRVLLATTTLAALGFAHAVVSTGLKVRTTSNAVLAVTIACLMLVTGTRTNLALAAAFVGAWGARRRSGVSFRRLAGLLASLIAATTLSLPVLSGIVVSDPQFLQHRLHAALSVYRGEGDQSLEGRQQAYGRAQEQFRAHVWFGTGPGYVDGEGFGPGDSPLAVPARFGLVGCACLAAFAMGVVMSVRRSSKFAGHWPIHSTARAWMAILVTLTPFGPWVADKGTALALALVVAGCAVRVREMDLRLASECLPEVVSLQNSGVARRIGLDAASAR